MNTQKKAAITSMLILLLTTQSALRPPHHPAKAIVPKPKSFDIPLFNLACDATEFDKLPKSGSPGNPNNVKVTFNYFLDGSGNLSMKGIISKQNEQKFPLPDPTNTIELKAITQSTSYLIKNVNFPNQILDNDAIGKIKDAITVSPKPSSIVFAPAFTAKGDTLFFNIGVVPKEIGKLTPDDFKPSAFTVTTTTNPSPPRASN